MLPSRISTISTPASQVTPQPNQSDHQHRRAPQRTDNSNPSYEPNDENYNEDDDDDPEALLTSFLPHLYPDEAFSCLGDPGKSLIYASPAYGDLQLMVPDYAAADQGEADAGAEADEGSRQQGVASGKVEEGRRLFAHYLWGGALVVAEAVERTAAGRNGGDDLERIGDGDMDRDRDEGLWNVKGERVLELGAGVALPSLISALAGTTEVAITDHPASSALYGAIQSNITNNIPSQEIRNRISIHPHAWGVFGKDEGGEREVYFAQRNKDRYTRIICADCLWMRDQHENLVRSILWFLAPPSEMNSGGVAWVVAGFHTGREIVASFFETAVRMGLVVEKIYERDVNATTEEGVVTREWKPYREQEEDRARWNVVAFLKRAVSTGTDANV